MAITPADIQAQTFSEAKRGYDPAEVDVFLEQLASEVDAMLNKIVDLKTRLTATEQELAAAQAQAQVAVQQALHVIDVLHTQRLVQAVFLGQGLLSSRTDGLFCHERAAGDQVHDKKGNRGHNEDAEDAHCDTLDDVLCHRLMPLHSYQ